MSRNRQGDVEAETIRLLQEALGTRPAPPTPPKPPIRQRRFRFGVGLLLLAPFCLVVAGFPWPRVELIDRLMWVGFALTLLFLGGWQIDKSNKESNSPDNPNDAHPGGESTSTLPPINIRRVK